jgi:DNA-binding XRE family transcriptional regulator
MNAIRLIARTDDTVTLSVADYEALVAAAEDAVDVASLHAAEAKEQELGTAAARADNLSDDAVGRLLSGEHPITIWREHRGLTVSALAEAAGVSRSYLAEIEAAKKPGSIQAFRRIASTLGVAVDDLLMDAE